MWNLANFGISYSNGIIKRLTLLKLIKKDLTTDQKL